jgi:uncharacterized SAM-binding protein YcdF (DUF218 family)
MPFTWICLLVVLAIKTKHDSKRKRYLIGAGTLLLFFSNSFILDEVMRKWEINSTPEPTAQSFDAIVVLGGVSNWDDELQRTHFSRGVDRLLQGIILHRKGIAPKLIFTGGSGLIAFPQYKEGDRIRTFLQQMNIPDSSFLIENESRNTYENAVMTAELINRNKIGKRILLVTSGFHMRRSLACFHKAGINAVPFSTDRYSGPRKFLPDHLLLPNAECFMGWNQLTHEWIGCLMYKLKGYL